MKKTLMNISEEESALRSEVIRGAWLQAQNLTDKQKDNIQKILATQFYYTWCVDTCQPTAECYADNFEIYTMGTYVPMSPKDYSDIVLATSGNSVNSHMTHDEVCYFLDDDNAILLSKLNDSLTYRDNLEDFEGFGYYMNYYTRCTDGVWRISKMRDTWMKANGLVRGVEYMFEGTVDVPVN